MGIVIAEAEMLSAFPGEMLTFYAACLLIAFFVHREQWLKTITLGFTITRVPMILGLLVAITMPLWNSATTIYPLYILFECAWYIPLAIGPYILVRRGMGTSIHWQPSTLFNGGSRLARTTILCLSGTAKWLFPHLKTAAQVGHAGTVSTVATLRSFHEQRQQARAERAEQEAEAAALAVANAGPTKSHHEMLLDRFGQHRSGYEPVTIYAPDGTPATIWRKPKRQLLGPNAHLYFSVFKYAGMAGFAIYLIYQLPWWLRPIAEIGVVGGGAMHFLHFNPLHLLGL